MLKARCNQVLKSPTLPNCEAEVEVCPLSKTEENILRLLCMLEMAKKAYKNAFHIQVSWAARYVGSGKSKYFSTITNKLCILATNEH